MSVKKLMKKLQQNPGINLSVKGIPRMKECLGLSLNNYHLASSRMVEVQVPFYLTQRIEWHVMAYISKINIFDPQYCHDLEMS